MIKEWLEEEAVQVDIEDCPHTDTVDDNGVKTCCECGEELQTYIQHENQYANNVDIRWNNASKRYYNEQKYWRFTEYMSAYQTLNSLGFPNNDLLEKVRIKLARLMQIKRERRERN